ncbi:DUF697 domain-containing protein [uncultured Psychrobacter sp.]|uniref:DUF697 domain-containing protein n=1 Tax=uncultured Psychrobacter sp. TaxID=259303 RepID=UPI002593557E|nr:DUF697 domain-containing protein [uncultured Psychrobacter sp.]
MDASKIKLEFNKQLNNFTKVNIMVVGGTGVGKSSLVNCVFGEDIARIGSGRPQTQGIDIYDNEKSPAVIFDTEGYEIFDGEIDNSNFQSVVLTEVTKRRTLELKDQIHLFWYCISVANHRITEYDLQNIKALKDIGVDLAIVLTKCDTEEVDENNEGVTSKAFKRMLREEGIKLNNIFETISEGDDNLELDQLIEWSVSRLTNDDLRASFVGAQKQSLKLKNKEANQIINMTSVSAASAAGLNPLPTTDSAILMPLQIALAVKLANIYGFTSMNDRVLDLMRTQVISLVGKQLASSLTKLVPVVGQVINASVAGSLTLALGHTLKQVYVSAYIGYLDTGKDPDWLSLFNELNVDQLLVDYVKQAQSNKKNVDKDKKKK